MEVIVNGTYSQTHKISPQKQFQQERKLSSKAITFAGLVLALHSQLAGLHSSVAHRPECLIMDANIKKLQKWYLCSRYKTQAHPGLKLEWDQRLPQPSSKEQIFCSENSQLGTNESELKAADTSRTVLGLAGSLVVMEMFWVYIPGFRPVALYVKCKAAVAPWGSTSCSTNLC